MRVAAIFFSTVLMAFIDPSFGTPIMTLVPTLCPKGEVTTDGQCRFVGGIEDF